MLGNIFEIFSSFTAPFFQKNTIVRNSKPLGQTVWIPELYFIQILAHCV